MKTRILTFAFAIASLFAFTPAYNVANAAPIKAVNTAFNKVTVVNVPITGTATNLLGQAVNFAGNFAISRFVTRNGELLAVGTLTGTLTNTVTGVVQNVSQLVRIPVDLLETTGSCTILHLVLGPVDLDLLGLEVHLDQVVLDITAQSGPGKLLGNLLCAIANLLNNGGPLNQLAGLLNQLLSIVNIPL